MTEHEPLSRAVVARRAAILDTLVTLQRQRGLRRRSRRAGLAALTLVAGCIVLWRAMPQSSSSRETTPQFVRSPAITIIEKAPRPLHVELMTDDQLITEMTALGLPCGLARFDDRTLVVSR